MSKSLNGSLSSYLTNVITGSLVSQRLRSLDIKVTSLTEGDPAIRAAADVIKAQGYNAEEISEHTIAALLFLVCHPENITLVIDLFSEVLWQTLGDPKSGPPPALYRKAATYIHAAVIQLIHPDVISACNHP